MLTSKATVAGSSWTSTCPRLTRAPTSTFTGCIASPASSGFRKFRLRLFSEARPQAISGPHLVRPDGTVSLGVYGSVQVAGQTLDEARNNIKGFLGQWFGFTPEAFLVIVDVAAYNSKSYYVITDGAGFGEPAYRFPVTGSETVLDALTQIQGLPAVASRRHVWVARRNPYGPANCAEQLLPVNWVAITQCGDTTTNYQVMPGDRIYVMAQPLLRTNNFISKLIEPVERVFGVTLLGSEMVNSIAGRPLR